MTGFIIGAALLVLLAVVLVVRPLIRRPVSADFSRVQLNAAIYRDQLAELECDRSTGVLPQDSYDQARAELQRRLLEDTATDSVTLPVATPTNRAMPVALALALPLGAVLLYLGLGNPQAINPPPQQRVTQDEVERMVAGLAAKLEKEPDNFKGWAMLARSYKVMGRYPEAVKAYERTGALLDGSADLLIDYADTLASVAGGFDKRVLVLIDKALRLEPTNIQGLWLRGTAAFNAKQYDKAITDWEALQKLLPAGSEDAGVVTANIAEARELKRQAGKRK